MTPFFRFAFLPGFNFSWGKELLTESRATFQKKKTFLNIEKEPSKYKFIFILIFAVFAIYYDRVRSNQSLIEIVIQINPKKGK